MSFTRDRRNQIKRYILEKINEGGANVVKRTAETFGISKNTVYRYIYEMEENGIIKRIKVAISL